MSEQQSVRLSHTSNQEEDIDAPPPNIDVGDLDPEEINSPLKPSEFVTKDSDNRN